MFSQFYVDYGKDQDGNTTLYRVPVRYADTNRNVASIIANNSENTLATVPIMVCYIDALRYDRERIQTPTYSENISVRARQLDAATGQTSTTQGNAFTINRMMPVPYRLTMKMEVWTTNFDQKLQIYEQILTVFNPALEIQSTDNFLDWTSLSYVLLSDINWTQRNIPVGTDDPIDVGTLTFEIPIWITPPAKLMKLGVIQQIIDSVYQANGNLAQAIIDQSILTANRQYFTPTGYGVIVLNGQVQLVNRFGPITGLGDTETPSAPGQPTDWNVVLGTIGNITNGISEMFLIDQQTNRAVAGTIALNPTDPTRLLFTINDRTVPSNSLPPITNIIDPTISVPGSTLPAAAVGQRYLILNPIGNRSNQPGNDPKAWRGLDNAPLIANANDIISWDGVRWNIIFDSQNHSHVEYVTNTYSGIQFKWSGKAWLKSWEGYYNEGFWSIAI